MILPKKYNNENGNFPQHEGKYKLSYSQYSSWSNPLYKADYIASYILNGPRTSNVWAEYGSEVGNYIENFALGLEQPKTKMLSVADEFILKDLDYPSNSRYEEEIVLDLGDFVVQGFIDRSEYKDNKVHIIDFKTGNAEKKVEFYSSEDYGQTTLYAHAKALEGFDIGESGVLLLGRKGNGFKGHPIRLSGEVVKVDTPYSVKKAEALIEKIRVAANEISECYLTYKKYF